MNIPIIEMGSQYPFGSGPKNVEECNELVVHKELAFQSSEEKQIIEQLLHFVKSVNHPNLINLVSTTQEPSSFHFYYQYVPLKLQPWILGVNQELSEELEEQLLELADVLTRASLTFNFDPNSVGLSHNMTVKYFLTQFSLDVQHQEQNRQFLQKQIKNFFQELRRQAGIDNKQTVNQNTRLGSVSTNSSVSHLQQFKTLSKSQCRQFKQQNQIRSPLKKTEGGTKLNNLYEKVQNSKLKSLEVLQKLKSLNRNKNQL